MKKTMKITQQWQIYIPKKVRQSLKLNQQTELVAEIEDDKLILTPKKNSIVNLAGKYSHIHKKSQKKVDIKNIRDQIDYSEL